MTWNYRIIKKIAEKEISFAFHEVYYDEQGQMTHWSEQPTPAFGESISELRNDQLWFWHAFSKPILIESEDESGHLHLIEDHDVCKINSGYEVEIMDRAAVAMAHFDDFVGNHPMIRQNTELAKTSQDIIDLMNGLYSEIAKVIIQEKEN